MLSSPVNTRVLRTDPVEVRAEILGSVEIEGQLERRSTGKAPRWYPACFIVKNARGVVFSRDIDPVNPPAELDLFPCIEEKGGGVDREKFRGRLFRLLGPDTKKHLKSLRTEISCSLAFSLEKGVQAPRQVFTLKLPEQGQPNWPCLRKHGKMLLRYLGDLGDLGKQAPLIINRKRGQGQLVSLPETGEKIVQDSMHQHTTITREEGKNLFRLFPRFEIKHCLQKIAKRTARIGFEAAGGQTQPMREEVLTQRVLDGLRLHTSIKGRELRAVPTLRYRPSGGSKKRQRLESGVNRWERGAIFDVTGRGRNMRRSRGRSIGQVKFQSVHRMPSALRMYSSRCRRWYSSYPATPVFQIDKRRLTATQHTDRL